jgi:DNA-binding FrmR family transcriptional regulator
MNKEKMQAVQALKTSKGQIEGIIKMMDEGRYCIDISSLLLQHNPYLKKQIC